MIKRQDTRKRHVQRRQPATQFDLVFEGGGAKGIVLTGALAAFLESGYTYGRLMGTSAGAIAATFLAAGYDGREMRRALDERDESGRPIMATFLSPPPAFAPELLDKSVLLQLLRTVDIPVLPEIVEDRIDDWLLQALLKSPLYRHLFSFVEMGGWFGAQDFRAFVKRKLNEGFFRGERRHFGDMTLKEFYQATRTDLSLLATDTTRGRLLVLNHRTAPDCPIVWAVRMSMGIPLLWQEVIWQPAWGYYRGKDIAGNAVVDGGVLSSFPIELFITEQPMWLDIMGRKTNGRLIGMLIDEELPVPGAVGRLGQDPGEALGLFRPLQRLTNLVDTMMRARDKMVIEQYASFVVRLPAKGYGTLEFEMSAARRAALATTGRVAMEGYLKSLEQAPPVSDVTALEKAAFTARADDVAARILGDTDIDT